MNRIEATAQAYENPLRQYLRAYMINGTKFIAEGDEIGSKDFESVKAQFPPLRTTTKSTALGKQEEWHYTNDATPKHVRSAIKAAKNAARTK